MVKMTPTNNEKESQKVVDFFGNMISVSRQIRYVSNGNTFKREALPMRLNIWISRMSLI